MSDHDSFQNGSSFKMYILVAVRMFIGTTEAKLHSH